MKKLFNISLAAVAILGLAIACDKDVTTTPENNPDVAPAGEIVTIKATLSDALTRVDFTPTISGGKTTAMALAWAEGDKVRVFNHDNREQYDDFTLAAEAVGEKVGVFTGTPTHLAGATSYDVEVINVIGNEEVTDGIINNSYDFYINQTQPKDGDPGDLKYFAKVKDINDYSDIQFDEVSGVLAISAKLPEGVAATIKSVDFIAGETLFPGDKELTITLTQMEDVGEDNILNLFATLDTEGVPSGGQPVELIVRFNAPGTGHTVYTRYVVLEWPTINPNSLNTININATESDVHAGQISDDGSADHPYLIGDKYQLMAMADLMVAGQTKYFKLVDDIDMTLETWTPLNPSPYTAAIHLDGNNKKIVHLISSLFDDLNGYVADLTIEDAQIAVGNATTGILANTVKTAQSTILNVDIIGTDNTSSVVANGYTGALIGQTDVKVSISDVDVINTNVTGTLAGGIVGYFNSEASLSESHFKGGTITANAKHAGGLVAATLASKTALISDCSVEEASITSAYNNMGGAVGTLRSGAVIERTTVGTTDVAVNIIATGTAACYTGGFVGIMEGGVIKDNCITHVAVEGVKTQIGGFVGRMSSGKVTGCKSYGTVSGPGTIGGFFGDVLGAEEISGNESHCTVTATSTYVGGFAGRLAGGVSCTACKHIDGKVWSNLGGGNACYIGGFAGYIGNTGEAFTGTISRCYVNKVVVDGVKYNNGNAASSGQYVGGFAGCIGSSTYANNTGIVEKCGVYASDKSGGKFIGGFAGASFAKIEQCRVNGTPTITGYADYIGGFIGKQTGHHVKYCYSNANIRHNNKKYVGGLIGNPDATDVYQCYSSGKIEFTGSSTSNQNVIGGMIGKGTNGFTYSLLIRWNDSNNQTIVGGETSVPSDCHVKLSSENNFEDVAVDLGWSHDGTIWKYPTDGGIPSLVNVP